MFARRGRSSSRGGPPPWRRAGSNPAAPGPCRCRWRPPRPLRAVKQIPRAGRRACVNACGGTPCCVHPHEVVPRGPAASSLGRLAESAPDLPAGAGSEEADHALENPPTTPSTARWSKEIAVHVPMTILSSSFTTALRDLVHARIATSWLMIGVANNPPSAPRLVMLKVRPGGPRLTSRRASFERSISGAAVVAVLHDRDDEQPPGPRSSRL